MILAGVVVFHPDPAHLRALVPGLRTQVAGVVLVLNRPLPVDRLRDLTAASDVSLIEASSNLGIGAGLSLLGTAAPLRGAGAIVFFDQDLSPPDGLIERLAAAWVDLEAAGHRPAVVSPLPVATAVLRRIGFFCADFFIDGIDLRNGASARPTTAIPAGSIRIAGCPTRSHRRDRQPPARPRSLWLEAKTGRLSVVSGRCVFASPPSARVYHQAALAGLPRWPPGRLGPPRSTAL